MELKNGFSLKNSFTLGLMLAVLIFNSLRFMPLNGSFSSISYLTATSREGSIQGNFVSIQEAINEAENGSTVLVPSGIYCEHVIVNKTISFVGENVSTTIIDGTNNGTVVSITADNVSISCFTIRNSGWGWTRNGVYVQADNCEIKNNFLIQNCHNIRVNYSKSSQVLENKIDGNGYGIRLMNAFNCTAIDNNVSGCIGGVHLENATNCVVTGNYITQNNQGVRLYSFCTFNKIVANTVYNNTYDGMIAMMPPNTTFSGNTFFHNSFVNNTYPFICQGSHIWNDDYPSGGNYWSRYNGTDLYRGPYQNETGSDGIGDAPYTINSKNVDHYPLMYPWGLFLLIDKFLAEPGDPRWDVNCDVNDDGIIDMADISTAIDHFPESILYTEYL
jgi:parallel beta-helix repeat protein